MRVHTCTHAPNTYTPTKNTHPQHTHLCTYPTHKHTHSCTGSHKTFKGARLKDKVKPKIEKQTESQDDQVDRVREGGFEQGP